MRISFPAIALVAPWNILSTQKDIAVVGCGQFAFSTVGYFYLSRFGERFNTAVDVNIDSLNSFSTAYRIPVSHICSENKLPRLSEDIQLGIVTSNHFSHTPYALQFIEQGIDVYVEKPLAVSFAQLEALKSAIQSSDSRLFVGYNRPYSAAITELVSLLNPSSLTMTITVIGHQIEKDHWYRSSKEGSRICGNLGHWIDLAYHILRRRGELDYIKMELTKARGEVYDENIALTITTNSFDLINIVLTSRDEPFEGIRESIVFQQKGLLAVIDDFREAEFHCGNKVKRRKYRPKDVGHQRALMQPFHKTNRVISEVLASTSIMLHLLEMAKNGETSRSLKCRGGAGEDVIELYSESKNER